MISADYARPIADPESETVCARCGGSTAPVECGCDDGAPCARCGGTGLRVGCVALPAACLENPRLGREHVARGTLEERFRGVVP